ncbi:hypothetical protein JL09_g6132, partial [Pichia kudriavzevii]
ICYMKVLLVVRTLES